MSDPTDGQFAAGVEESLRVYLGAMDARDMFRARLAAASMVAWCRSIVEDATSTVSGREKANALLSGILCAACRDFVDCYELVRKERLTNKEIETLWSRLIDCLERLEYVAKDVKGTAVDWLTKQVSGLQDHLNERLGPGLYCSPEIVLDRETCSICGDDFRACMHRAGHIYDGIRCKWVAQVSSVRNCSIVAEPVDRRCRIWPWNFDDGSRSFSAAILTLFQVDDLRDPRDSPSDPQSMVSAGSQRTGQ